MEVHFSPEEEALLSRIAARAGTDAEHLVKDAALRLVAENQSFRAVVGGAIAPADLGELTDDDEVYRWLEQKECS
jgi:hypothetical protein